MKQSAKLAQAIVHGPKLLILDEPTNALDPPARQRMIRLIREMRDSHHMHIVVCSHLLKDVEDCCEEVMILRDGELVHYANLEEERRANRRFLELETIGATEEFLSAIERLGCECAMTSEGRVKVVLGDSVEIRDIYGLAGERQIQIRRLSYRKDTLEDIFLKAMDAVPNGGAAVEVSSGGL
jgi:ABC-2 type transport system ATP-binding protein